MQLTITIVGLEKKRYREQTEKGKQTENGETEKPITEAILITNGLSG